MAKRRTAHKYEYINGELVDVNAAPTPSGLPQSPDPHSDPFPETEISANAWQRKVLGERHDPNEQLSRASLNDLGGWGMGLPREGSANYVNPNILMARDLGNTPTPLSPSTREGFARIYQLGVQSGASLSTPLDLSQFGLLFPQTEKAYKKQLAGIKDPYIRSLAGNLRDVNPQALPTTFGGLKQALMGTYYPEALTYANSLKGVRMSAGDVVGNIFADFDDNVTAWDPDQSGFFGYMQNQINASARGAARTGQISAMPLSAFDGPQNGAEEELFAFQQSGVDDMSEVLHVLQNSINGVYKADYAGNTDLKLLAYAEEIGVDTTGPDWKQRLRQEVIRRGYDGAYGMEEIVSGLEDVQPAANVPWYRQLSEQLHPERGSGATVPSPFYVPKGQSLWVPNEHGLTFSPDATANKPLVQGLLRTPKEVQKAVSVVMQYRNVPQLPADVRLLNNSLREAWLYRNNPTLANASPEEYAQLLPQEMKNPSNFPPGWRQQLIGQINVEDVRLSKTGKPIRGNFGGIPVNMLVPNVQNKKTGTWRGQPVITRGDNGRLRVNPNYRTEDTHELAYVTAQEVSMYGDTLDEVSALRKMAREVKLDGDEKLAADLRAEADKLVDPELASTFRKGMKTTSTGLTGKETVGGNVLGNMGVFENAIAHGKYDAEPRQYTFDEIRSMRDKALQGLKDPIAREMVERRYNNMMKAAGGEKVYDIDDVPAQAENINDAEFEALQKLHAKETQRVANMSPLDRMADAIERNTGTSQVSRTPREKQMDEFGPKAPYKPAPRVEGRAGELNDVLPAPGTTFDNLSRSTTYVADDKGSLTLEPQATPANLGKPGSLVKAPSHVDQLFGMGRVPSTGQVIAAMHADRRGATVYSVAEQIRREQMPRVSEDQAISDAVGQLTERDATAQMSVDAARSVIGKGVLRPGFVSGWQQRRKDLAPIQTDQFNAGRDAVNQYNNALNAKLNAVELGPLDPSLKGYAKDLITHEYVAKHRRVTSAAAGTWDSNYAPPPPENFPDEMNSASQARKAQVNATLNQPAQAPRSTTQPVTPQSVERVSDVGNEVMSEEEMLAEYGAPPEEDGWSDSFAPASGSGNGQPPVNTPPVATATPEPPQRPAKRVGSPVQTPIVTAQTSPTTATSNTVARSDDAASLALQKAESAAEGLRTEFPDFLRDHFGRGKENKERFAAWRSGLGDRQERFEGLWKDLHAQRPYGTAQNPSVYTKMVDTYGWKGDPDVQPDPQATQAFLQSLTPTENNAGGAVPASSATAAASTAGVPASSNEPRGVTTTPASASGHRSYEPMVYRPLTAEDQAMEDANIARQRQTAEAVRANPQMLEGSTVWTPEEQALAQAQRQQPSDDPVTAWRQQSSPRGSGAQTPPPSNGGGSGAQNPPPPNGGPDSPSGPNDPMDPKKARAIMMGNKAFIGGVAHGLLGDENMQDFAQTQGPAFQKAFDTLRFEMFDALGHSRRSEFSQMYEQIRANTPFLGRSDQAADQIPTSVRMTKEAREYAAALRAERVGDRVASQDYLRGNDTFAFEMEAEDLNREAAQQTNNGVLPESAQLRTQRKAVAQSMMAGIRPGAVFDKKAHAIYGEYKETSNQWVDPKTGEVTISQEMMNEASQIYQGARATAFRAPLNPALNNNEVAATIHARMGEMLKTALDQYEAEVAKTQPDKAKVAELRKKMDMLVKGMDLEGDKALEAAFGAGGFKDLTYAATRAHGKALEQYMSDPQVAAKVQELGGLEAVMNGDRQVIQAGEQVLEVGAAPKKPAGGFAGKMGHLGSIYQTTLGHMMMAQFMGSMAWKSTGGSVLDAASQYGMSQYSYVGMANYGDGSPTGATMYAARQELAAERIGDQAYAQYGMFNELGYVASNLPGGAGQFAVRGINDLKMAGGLGLAAGIGTWGLGSLAGGVGATMTAGGLAAGAGVTAAGGLLASVAAPVGLAVGVTALAGLGSMNLYNAAMDRDSYSGLSLKNFLGGQVFGLTEQLLDPAAHSQTNFLGGFNPIRGMLLGDATNLSKYSQGVHGMSQEDYVRSGPLAKLIGEENVEWLYEGQDPQTQKLKKLVDSLSSDTGFKPEEIAGSIKAIQMTFGGIETEKDTDAAKFFVKQMADQGLSVEAGLSAVDQLAGYRGVIAGTEEFQSIALQYAAIPSAAEKQKEIIKAGRDYQKYAQWVPYLEGGTAEGYALYNELGGTNMAQTQAIQSVFSQSQMNGINLTPQMAETLAKTANRMAPFRAMDAAQMASSLYQMGAGTYSGNFTDLASSIQSGQFGFTLSDAGNLASGTITQGAGNKNDTLAFLKGVTGGNMYALSDYGRMADIGVLQALDPNGLQTGLKDMSGLLTFANQNILRKPNLNGAQTLAGLGMTFGSTSQNALLEGGIWGYQQSMVDQTNALQATSLSLQFGQLAYEKQSMFRGWGIEDRTVSEQWSSQLRNFEYQGTMMDTQRRHRLEDAEYQRTRTGLSNENTRWTQAFDYQTSLMRRDWAREDYQFNTQMRQLSFGWNMEDMDEQIRRSSGYERHLLIRQRDRATLSNNLQEGQAETQFERQEKLWEREDERYQKGLAFNEKMMEMDLDRFERNQQQAEEIYLLQKGHLADEMDSATKLHELRLEMETLQRERQQEQLRHSEQSLNIQKQMMNLQNEYADNMTIINHTQAEMEATLRKITSYSPAFSRMLGDFLSFLEDASRVSAPSVGPLRLNK